MSSLQPPALPVRSAALGPVKRAVARAAFRTRLFQVADGRGMTLDLGSASGESAAILASELRWLAVDAPTLQRVVRGLAVSGALDRILDDLAGRDRELRLRSVRLAGVLRIEAAAPWLEPLLASSQPRLRGAAARALGRIGGVRAADALVRGLGWRRGSTARLVMELARAAPDLYLEDRMADARYRRVRASLVLAAGLRKRRTSLPVLLELLEKGSRTERAMSARAIGWIGCQDAGAPLVYALTDPEWQVRSAAVKALGGLRGVGEDELSFSLLDRSPRVRQATAHALRRRHPRTRRQGGPLWR